MRTRLWCPTGASQPDDEGPSSAVSKNARTPEDRRKIRARAHVLPTTAEPRAGNQPRNSRRGSAPPGFADDTRVVFPHLLLLASPGARGRKERGSVRFETDVVVLYLGPRLALTRENRMKPGRNDPCPCGSGKKHKKCCLNNASPPNASTSPEHDTTFEPRFLSTAPSYYTAAALEEASKKGGMVEMHPYARLKWLGDPRRSLPTRQGRLPRSRATWFPDTLAALSSEEIERRLELLGARCDRAFLTAKATPLGSAWSLARSCFDDAQTTTEADLEFIGLAVCELWRRHCPERPSIEMVDDWICEGYAYVSARKMEPASIAWWKVWEAIRPALDGQDLDLSSVGDRLFPRMSQCLANWGVDFRMELANAAVDDPRLAELGIRFIREIHASFPDSQDAPTTQADLTRLLFAAGRDAEAEDCAQRIIDAHPRDPQGYVALTDEWTFRGARRPDGAASLRRAIDLLEAALHLPVDRAEDYDLQQRLADARKALSEKEPNAA